MQDEAQSNVVKSSPTVKATLQKIARTYSDEEMKMIGDLVPDNQNNKKRYVALVSETVLGVDKQGNLRPFEDLALLLYTAKLRGLDPLARQIYGIYRWDSKLGREKMTLQTSIDGFRLIAQRQGDYAGSDDVVFDEEEGKPKKATVTVYKLNKMTGERMPIVASARWDEYVVTYFDKKTNKTSTLGLWASKPFIMLGKCAEALALRKAFPQELSGIYIDEEMAQERVISKVSSVLAELPTPDGKGKKEETPVERDITKDTAVAEEGEVVESTTDTQDAPKVERTSASAVLDDKLNGSNVEKGEGGLNGSN